MQTLLFLIGALAALGMTALVARVPAPAATPRRERLNRLSGQVLSLFGIALVFPLWDYVLVDSLVAPLPHIWSREQGVVVGALILLALPFVMASRSPDGLGMLGWRWPGNGGAALAVVVFSAVFS